MAKVNKVKYDSEANRVAFGANGFLDIENGTVTSADDRFAVLEAEGDTVFAFDNEAPNGTTTSASYLLKDGRFRYGYFKNIVVSSGKLVSYYAD